jgi:hypothetical protein
MTRPTVSRKGPLEKIPSEELQHREPTQEEADAIDRAAKGRGVQRMYQNGTPPPPPEMQNKVK